MRLLLIVLDPPSILSDTIDVIVVREGLVNVVVSVSKDFRDSIMGFIS